MARQLSEINAGGELTSINLGGTTPEAAVPTQADLDLKANISDVGAGLDVKLDKDLADFTLQIGDPVSREGRVFYDQSSHSLSVLSDIGGTVLNLGQEEYIRVINTSGAAIINGSACKHAGVLAGLPAIALAQATSFTNALVLGIATHDIANGAEGFITTHGKVGGLHTGGHPEGQPMYLSADIAGAWTSTPPEIVSQIGGILVADAADGSLMVNIMNNISLPVAIGFMTAGVVPATINATPVIINNYVTSHSRIITADAVAGSIAILNDGFYRVTATVNIAHNDTGNSTGIASLDIYDGTAEVVTMGFTIAKNQEGTNLSLSLPFVGIVGTTYSLRVLSSLELTGVVDKALSFDIEAIHITAH